MPHCSWQQAKSQTKTPLERLKARHCRTKCDLIHALSYEERQTISGNCWGGTSNAKLACLGVPTTPKLWFHRGSSLSDSPAKRSNDRPPGTRRQFLGFASRGRPLFGTPHGSPKDNVCIAWQGFFMNRGQLINVPECRGNTPQKATPRQRHGILHSRGVRKASRNESSRLCGVEQQLQRREGSVSSENISEGALR